MKKKVTPPASCDEPLSLAGHRAHLVGVAYSPGGRSLASWGGEEVRTWDLSGGAGQARPLLALKPITGPAVSVVSWSPDGARLAVRTMYNGTLLLTASDGRLVRRVPIGHDNPMITFTPTGHLLRVTYDQEKRGVRYESRLELRDAESDAVLASEKALLDADLFPSGFGPVFRGPRIYLACHSTALWRWQPDAGDRVRLFDLPEDATDLAVSEDERLAVTSSGKRAYVWSLPDGALKATLEHRLTCKGVEVLPGPRVLTACNDGHVRLWDTAGGLIQALDLGMGKVTCLDVSPDGMTFAAGVEKKKRVVLMDVPE